jgi:glycosyltransferase involved in cell wall biosynthesis
MKIAILGTRGIPARYGGFETFAEQLSKRLVAHGHEVTVYCRRPFTTPADVFDPRIRRVILPTVSHKYLDTAFHTLLSAIHVSWTDAEVILCCNVANSPWIWIPRLFGKPTVLNVDGLDRKRRKWNFIARAFIGFCEALATFTPTRIVTDARLIQDYYRRRFGKDSTMIGYGAEVPPGSDRLEGFDLPPGKFILYVSRLEPENNPELVIEAYKKVQTDWPLVMVGGNPYDPAYVARLKSLADQRVVFLGGVYGPGYWQLLINAGLYIFACEIGGVHPALVEAMAAEKAILYLDTPENRETAGDSAMTFCHDATDLAARMTQLLGDESQRGALAQKARQRAEAAFSWDAITRSYESLFTQLVNKNKAVSPAN